MKKTNAPEHDQRAPCIIGHIKTPAGMMIGEPLEVCVRRCDNDDELCRAPVDGSGRFRISSIIDDSLPGRAIELNVLRVSSGELLGKQITVHPQPGRLESETVNVSLPSMATVQTGDRQPIPMPRSQRKAVAEQWRMAVAQKLRGRVPERDSRPIVPKGINRAITELNSAVQLGRRILNEDIYSGDRFLSIIESRQVDPGQRLAFSGGRGLRKQEQILGSTVAGQSPCVFDDGGPLEITLAALILDIYRVEAMGDLTQRGAYTRRASAFLHERYNSLRSFSHAVIDLEQGKIAREEYEYIVYDPAEGLEGEPFYWPEGDSRQYPESPIGPFGPIPIPGRSPQQDLPCDLSWVDCVDEMVDFANSYEPPASCPNDAAIGGVTPSAICMDKTNVEIEIRPKPGKSFAGDETQCFVRLQRYGKQAGLEVLSYASDLVKVRLKKAAWSGCIGFRGSAGGSTGNVAFINSCMRQAHVQNRVLTGLVTNAGVGSGFNRAVKCTGLNQFDVVGDPRIAAMSAVGQDGGTSAGMSQTSITLVAEACTAVALQWRFEFDDDFLDPAKYIRVRVSKADGSIVEEGLLPDSSIFVDEPEDETYTVLAVATVGGEECGRAQGTITITRYDALHLSGPIQLQVNYGDSMQVRSSCPAPAGGISIQLAADPSNRLAIPASAVIPAGQDSVTFDIEALGSQCADVIVTAQAAGHLDATHLLTVYDRPQLFSLSPDVIDACRPFELTIEGTCFKEGETTVRANKPGESEKTLAIVAIEDTSIRCQGSDFPPGDWRIDVVSRGLVSNSFLDLRVRSVAPTIEIFTVTVLSTNSDMIVPCMDNQIRVDWRVKDASRVTVYRDDTQIDDEVLGGCGGPFENTVFDTVTGQVTYRLKAYPVGGGNSKTSTRTLDEIGIQTLTLYNQSDKWYVIWVYDAAITDADLVPLNSPTYDLKPQENLDLTFQSCDYKHLVGVDREMAMDEDEDPYGSAIKISHLTRDLVVVIGADNGADEPYTIY